MHFSQPNDWIAKLADPLFWRQLAPQWSIGEASAPTPFLGSLPPITATEQERQRQLIRREGYLQSHLNWAVDLQPMAQLVRRLDQLGIPPVFAYLYDPFWIPFFQLHGLLSGLLGGSYRMLPDCWIWNIDPSKQGQGWPPHRDRDHTTLRSDGAPKIINVWLPLSSATPLNSCMYVLPADRDPVYGTNRDRFAPVDLSHVRALPAVPGDVLIWNQAVLHWGSASSDRASESRVSMAWEFQRTDEPHYNQPLLQTLQFPCFNDRLRMIAQQILHFGSPGFFARVEAPFMDWAARTNPEAMAPRRHEAIAKASQQIASLASPASPTANLAPGISTAFTVKGNKRNSMA